MFQQVLGPLQGIPGRKVVPEIPIEFKFMKIAVCIVTGCPEPIFVTPCGKGVVFSARRGESSPTEHSGLLRKTPWPDRGTAPTG